jgi:hydrogenase nickel incorporation protein HypA/HybF
MHELSIATSILDLARRHTPEGASLQRVHLRAGPLRGIEPQAMQWAWQACTSGTEADGSTIEIEYIPWRLRCGSCGREFTADDVFQRCVCGALAHPVGGDELQITSIDVDEPCMKG